MLKKIKYDKLQLKLSAFPYFSVYSDKKNRLDRQITKSRITKLLIFSVADTSFSVFDFKIERIIWR